MTSATFTLPDMQTELYVLAGARQCRSYHLTADTLAAEYMYSCTDEEGTVSFRSLCGKTIVDTLVQPSTDPDHICRRCVSKAIWRVEAW